MKKNNKDFLIFFSAVSATLAILAAAGALAFPGLYNDNEFVKTSWFANDLVTLVIVVPILLFALVLSRKENKIGLLSLTGVLGYLVYNYAFYLFGAAFNVLFLVYALLLLLSSIALLFSFSNTALWEVAASFPPGTPVKWISIFLFVIGTMLFSVEMMMIMTFIFSGTLPDTIRLTGHPTSVVFALDLVIVVPGSITAAILLWKRQPAGYLLAMVMLIKSFTYGCVLCLGTILLARSPHFGRWDPLLPFYILIAIGGLLGGGILMCSLRKRADEGLTRDQKFKLA